ncbi:MAG: hypothetical protein K0M48_10850 [Thiobacillus sp.]|nr:hypothetical protein [Thiobacillus sp.]
MKGLPHQGVAQDALIGVQSERGYQRGQNIQDGSRLVGVVDRLAGVVQLRVVAVEFIRQRLDGFDDQLRDGGAADPVIDPFHIDRVGRIGG